MTASKDHPDEYVPTLGDYAEIIDALAGALGGPATGRDALPVEMHRAYYDAIDRAGMRRVVRAMEQASPRCPAVSQFGPSGPGSEHTCHLAEGHDTDHRCGQGGCGLYWPDSEAVHSQPSSGPDGS